MSKNIVKKLVCGVLAVTSLAACVVTTTSCETNKPEVTVTITFEGEEYALNYELDRRVAPRTVKHFLFLAENNYYDGLAVHDYSSDLLYTGGYSYSEDGDLVYKPYYDVVKEYANFPASVWTTKNGEEYLYTLAGEFTENKFNVTSGALRQTYGSLTMYYTDKDVDNKVCVEYLGELEEDDDKYAYRPYEFNSATSLFYISLSNSSTKNDEYCTFAKLKDASKETLDDFVDALEAYVEENHDTETDSDNTFTKSESVTVDTDDEYVTGKKTVTYHVPQSPIVIKSVVVNKY